MEKIGHIILNGDKKVMFSAPHAVEQTRDGKIKYAEQDTGEIARFVNKLGYPCIIKTENLNDDANYDLNCKYKSDLQKYIKDNNIVALIDLHELSPLREQLICLGTGGEDDINLLGDNKKALALKEYFEKYFKVVELNNPFSAKGEVTIARYTSNFSKIPCVQIEMNCKLFVDNMITAEDMAKVMAGATEIMGAKINEKDSISK